MSHDGVLRDPHTVGFERQRCARADGSNQDRDEGGVPFALSERGDKVPLSLLRARPPAEELASDSRLARQSAEPGYADVGPRPHRLHAYSAYARGLDDLRGMYKWLDRAPDGRNETGVRWRRHAEYDKH